jgi:hypothetical protein
MKKNLLDLTDNELSKLRTDYDEMRRNCERYLYLRNYGFTIEMPQAIADCKTPAELDMVLDKLIAETKK